MRRLTIRRIKSYKRKEKYILVIMFFLIAPLVSIVFGKIVSKRIIVPYISSNTEKAKESANNNVDKVEKIAELDELDLYNIEVKEFLDLPSAEDFLNKLNLDGILGYVSKSNNKYKVFTSITFNKKEVEDQLKKIKEKYPNSKIKSIRIQGKQLDINESDKEVVNTTNLINKIYIEELSMWQKNMSEANYEEIKIKMNKNNTEIEKSIEKYSDKINNDDLKNLYSILKENVDNRKKQLMNSILKIRKVLRKHTLAL
ncbi:hypothetical protein [Gottschalkia acidurici]|uniref:hypothetical protein n=1 Tax=Clostridium acidurici TaxID=1556 RepID=UPI0005A0846C|nr:hypothetical protein [Gottschalkia acidurici]